MGRKQQPIFENVLQQKLQELFDESREKLRTVNDLQENDFTYFDFIETLQEDSSVIKKLFYMLVRETFLQYKRQKESQAVNNNTNEDDSMSVQERRATGLLRALILASTLSNENSTSSNNTSSNNTSSNRSNSHTLIRENPFRRILLNDTSSQSPSFPSLFSDSDEDEDL